jgi:hypothetical protein
MDKLEKRMDSLELGLAEVHSELKSLRECQLTQAAKSEATIANAKADLIKWAVGLFIAQAGLTAAVVKAFN